MPEENENHEENNDNQGGSELEKQFADMKAELDAMREHQAKLLDETKKAKEEKRVAAEEAEKERLAKAEKEGDFKELLADSEKKRQALEEQLNQTKTATENARHSAEAMKIASGLTSDTSRAGILAEKIQARTKLSDDGLKVLNEQGELTVSPVDDLVVSLKTDFPFLVDGSQASGGNAGGNNQKTEHKGMNEAAEAAKKKGDTVGMIDAILKQNLKKGS